MHFGLDCIATKHQIQNRVGCGSTVPNWNTIDGNGASQIITMAMRNAVKCLLTIVDGTTVIVETTWPPYVKEKKACKISYFLLINN